MIKNALRKIALLVLVITGSCFTSERTVLSFDFDRQIPPIKTLSGSWKKVPFGISLKEDSRIAIAPGAGSQIINGRVSLGFHAPILEKSILPLKDRSEECLCALKINIGRCLVEATEKGISLKLLDKSFSSVESVLGSVDLPFDPHGAELTLSLTIFDRTATVCINDSLCVLSPAPDYWFGVIEIASYNTPFVLTSYSLTSLSRDTLSIDTKRKFVDCAGIYHPSRFNAGSGQHNHSFITWEGGTAAYNALFTVMAPETAVYNALVAIGAAPGNNLTLYPWSRIHDPHFEGPEKKTAGARLSIAVVFEGNSYAPSSFLRSENGKAFDFRFSGNEKNNPETRTGCIVCLESCPIGKIGNAAYSMRDMIRNVARFSVVPDQPFKEADEVTLRLSLLPAVKSGK
jgi:hypothetical protein